MTEAPDIDIGDGLPAPVAGNGHDAAVVAEATAGAPVRGRTRHDPAVVAKARALVETTILSQTEIGRRLGVAPTTVSYWQAKYAWTRPAGAPARPAFSQTANGARIEAPVDPMARAKRLTARLYRVFARQIGALEARIAKVEDGGPDAEKDARALATLARTLKTLMALERDDGASPTDPEAVDPDEIRARIARRLYALGQSGE